jgi:hypothetical protein
VLASMIALGAAGLAVPTFIDQSRPVAPVATGPQAEGIGWLYGEDAGTSVEGRPTGMLVLDDASLSPHETCAPSDPRIRWAGYAAGKGPCLNRRRWTTLDLKLRNVAPRKIQIVHGTARMSCPSTGNRRPATVEGLPWSLSNLAPSETKSATIRLSRPQSVEVSDRDCSVDLDLSEVAFPDGSPPLDGVGHATSPAHLTVTSGEGEADREGKRGVATRQSRYDASEHEREDVAADRQSREEEREDERRSREAERAEERRARQEARDAQRDYERQTRENSRKDDGQSRW